MPPYVIPLIVAFVGTGGFFWAVVNFRRDDTGKVIAQTGEIVTMLRALIAELEGALQRSELTIGELTKQRDEALAECRKIRLRLDEAERQLVALGYTAPDV